MKSVMTRCFLFLAVLMLTAFYVSAQENDESTESSNALIDSGLTINQAASLDELLENIKEGRITENNMHEQRVLDFQRRANDQQTLLKQTEDELVRQQGIGKNLEVQFEDNKIEIANKQEELDTKLGTLRELFGVIQQVAGDTRGVFSASVVSGELPPERGEFLGDLAVKMGTSSDLATIDELTMVFYYLQQHINETGRVSRFTGEVSTHSGNKVKTPLLRVGAFNIVSRDGYVNFDTTLQKIVALPRQPSAEFASTAKRMSRARPGEVVAFAIDPTRGGLLSLETERATLGEMVGSPFGGIMNGSCFLPFCDGQGGTVGSIIILVGIIGVILAVTRMIILFFIGRKVTAQRQDLENPRDDNPLGRLLTIYHSNRDVDNETLQLKMGEAILSEMPVLTRHISIVQVISVVAPLMGLLGTVIGMIQTFQAITLFGTGDPKIMAGGISTALMTTVLGLCVAIPTVLLHALTSQFSRSVIHVLDEQSEGIIAQHAEDRGTPIRETA